MVLALAAIGVYGVAAQVGRVRTKEIGIRLALGATTADIARAFVMRGLAFAVIAVAAGTLVATSLY